MKGITPDQLASFEAAYDAVPAHAAVVFHRH